MGVKVIIMGDEIKIEILPDGRVRIESDAIDDPIIHTTAEKFLSEVQKLLGGKTEKARKKLGHHKHHGEEHHRH